MSRSVDTSRQLAREGALAIERGDWSGGEARLAKAVETCPADAEARRRYAEALWRRGSTAEAIAQVEEAWRLAPSDIDAAVLAGQWRLASGRDDLAMRAAQRALAIDARFAPAWALRGNVFQSQGDLRQSLADYQRSLAYSPNSPEVLLRVAELYRRLNQPERALLALQTWCDSCPPGEEPVHAIYLQGRALAALGRHEEAANRLAECLRREPPTPEILFRLAKAQHAQGRLADAQATALQALSLAPDHAPSRILVDEMRTAQGVAPAADRR